MRGPKGDDTPHRVIYRRSSPRVVGQMALRAYRVLVPSDRNHRESLSLDVDVVLAARKKAAGRGDVLTGLVREALISATKAAKAGRGASLPRALAPQPRSPRGGGARLRTFRYLVPEEEAAECRRELDAAGSSPEAIAEGVLSAFTVADGSRLDTPLPGEDSAAWQAMGAA